jgi:drug/metabolite transporter (DMT)-like permease
MIDYILILLAVCCFAAQFAFTKLYEGAVRQTACTSLVMLVCTGLVGALIFLCVGGFSVAFSPISALWAVIFALIMIPYYMIGIKVLSLGSLAIYSMFMMLGGMLVPFFYGILLLNEGMSVGKLAGTLLLTVFIVLQAVWQREPQEARRTGGGSRYLFFVLCLLIFFINGMTGVVAKAHSISVGAVDEISFTVTYCAMTALLSLVLLFILAIRGKREALTQIGNALKPRPLLVMCLLGAAAYGGNFLQLLAADKVPASVQFPLVSGGVIVLSALVSALCFRERISRREWISVAGAFLSTLLFAF